uniref:NAD-dependent epimerase/dehydratase family protein n=1 Tax=Ignisphaera aggregans TaxID=334771 RepID=A0A7J3MWI1_9CREN
MYREPLKLPIDESHSTKPLLFYRLSKLQGEEVLKVFTSTYSLKYITLRLFNTYGPRQKLFIRQCRNGLLREGLKG